MHIEEDGIELTRSPLFANNTLHWKYDLQDKVVSRSKLGNTQLMIGLLCAALEVMSYSF